MYKIIENISIFSGNTKKFQFMNDSDSSILLSSAVGEFEDLKGEVVIEGLSKEQGLFIFLPKYGGGLLHPGPVPTVLHYDTMTTLSRRQTHTKVIYNQGRTQ